MLREREGGREKERERLKLTLFLMYKYRNDNFKRKEVKVRVKDCNDFIRCTLYFLSFCLSPKVKKISEKCGHQNELLLERQFYFVHFLLWGK